jgi:hypothetical protein
MKMIPLFFVKKGWWGEKGYVKVSFRHYLYLFPVYVTKVRWVKCGWMKKK